MTWTETKAVLARLGLTGFKSYAHFRNFMDYEIEDKQLENRIKKALRYA